MISFCAVWRVKYVREFIFAVNRSRLSVLRLTEDIPQNNNVLQASIVYDTPLNWSNYDCVLSEMVGTKSLVNRYRPNHQLPFLTELRKNRNPYGYDPELIIEIIGRPNCGKSWLARDINTQFLLNADILEGLYRHHLVHNIICISNHPFLQYCNYVCMMSVSRSALNRLIDKYRMTQTGLTVAQIGQLLDKYTCDYGALVYSAMTKEFFQYRA